MAYDNLDARHVGGFIASSWTVIRSISRMPTRAIRAPPRCRWRLNQPHRGNPYFNGSADGASPTHTAINKFILFGATNVIEAKFTGIAWPASGATPSSVIVYTDNKMRTTAAANAYRGAYVSIVITQFRRRSLSDKLLV